MGWTGPSWEGYAEAMKPEELRRYEEEFKASREMLGTYYLELGLAASSPKTAAEARTQDEPAGSPGPGTHPTLDPISPAPLPSGHR
jgi:hypothetical protein